MVDTKNNGHSAPERPTLFAENNMPQALISGNIADGNPGVKLIQNDDRLSEMLKAVYIEDYELARNVAEALGECDEFLYNKDGKPNKDVERRIEWIKYILATFCSVKGRFAQAYLDGATGIRTSTFTERGWQQFTFNNKSREYNAEPNNKQSGPPRS